MIKITEKILLNIDVISRNEFKTHKQIVLLLEKIEIVCVLEISLGIVISTIHYNKIQLNININFIFIV